MILYDVIEQCCHPVILLQYYRKIKIKRKQNRQKWKQNQEKIEVKMGRDIPERFSKIVKH